ncbi:MAG: LptF/LptG family permease, partial [Flavobacteriaceae bacterium]|nr:LptF/LptG family permease [Flavobacteriaceae bacterium]
LPIAILLSSIMALGNLSENYEFAAVKSAGISLRRFIRPLIVLMVVLSGLNFLFLNYAFPRAAFKFKNLLLDMQKTKPALALIPGTFNTEIPGYSIKFAEKYGEEDNLLRDVHIYYDLNKSNANTKVIKAEKGKIISEEGSKYMTLVVEKGYHYEDIIPKKRTYQKTKSMPFTKSYFNEYTVNIDISELSDIDASEYKQDREMLSLNQLSYYTDSLKTPYDEFIQNKAEGFYKKAGVKEMYTDSLFKKDLEPLVLENFDSVGKLTVINNALINVESTLSDIKNFKKVFKNKQKFLNVYNTEYHRRLAFSVACLVLFFIGAPLGSIIRKGGFGLPMILAILIFVVYYFVSTLGRNMAHSSSITAPVGGWLATFVLFPLGLLLMRRATQDKGIFNLDLFLQPVTDFFKRLFQSKNK